MSKIDYKKYFEQPLEKEKYAVQLKLVSPKKDFNLDEDPEGIDISKTFNEVSRKFNTHKGRNVDGAEISEIEISNKCIYFMVTINKGKLTKMRSLIGNSISKWLYTDYNWKCLVSENNKNDKNKLFSLDHKKI